MMQQQYLTTRDIKFPDQKQYTKPGDLILWNDVSGSLTIYRDEALIGTVHFSKSGLLEFIRLGWIVKPTDIKSQAKALVVPEPVKFNPTLPEEDFSMSCVADLPKVSVDEHTVPSALPVKPRKAKKN